MICVKQKYVIRNCENAIYFVRWIFGEDILFIAGKVIFSVILCINAGKYECRDSNYYNKSTYNDDLLNTGKILVIFLCKINLSM